MLFVVLLVVHLVVVAVIDCVVVVVVVCSTVVSIHLALLSLGSLGCSSCCFTVVSWLFQ